MSAPTPRLALCCSHRLLLVLVGATEGPMMAVMGGSGGPWCRLQFAPPVSPSAPKTLCSSAPNQAYHRHCGSLSHAGTDYDTRDGTCVRDYIHVMDLGACCAVLCVLWSPCVTGGWGHGTAATSSAVGCIFIHHLFLPPLRPAHLCSLCFACAPCARRGPRGGCEEGADRHHAALRPLQPRHRHR